MSKRYYITTPIYYVNSVPHLGTALTTFASDVTARYQMMQGHDVMFLTGTDENGLKVLEAAQAQSEDPIEFVNRISEQFKVVWRQMDIRFDDFIRTTEPRHIDCVHTVFDRLRDAGHIYLGKYEGWYDVSSETFFKESDLVDGKSPDGNEVRWVEEENWFFRLSAFSDAIREHIASHPEFILPEVRRNEVVGFLDQGLRDVCVSRTNPGWGIEVPGDSSKVVYVWFDALINYLSATGWPNPRSESLWPADVQWMGKDILTRFHATLWPAMLIGLGLPLPQSLVGHGWLTIGGEKISKSKGNVIPPYELAGKLAERASCDLEVAVDAVRHYMAATMPYESDTVFTPDEFDRRYNTDLANDLGNALNRSLAMTQKFAGGAVPEAECEEDAIMAIRQAASAYEFAMNEFRIDRATEAAWSLVRFLNKYIDTRAPWALAKANDPALPAVLRSMLLCLRSCEALVRPTMPTVADRIAEQLNLPPQTSWVRIGAEESLPGGRSVGQATPIFPRLDLKKEQASRASASASDAPAAPAAKPESPTKPAEKPKPAPAPATGPSEPISIEDFAKVQLRVARVLEAEPIEGSDKLLKLQLVVGEERRQIVAGIRKSYQPIDLIGRQVVIVYNLKPARLRGVESQGMLLAADDGDGGAILLQPDSEAAEGAKVK